MKAIKTQYKGPTDTNGSRIIASDTQGNRITIPYDYSVNSDQAHEIAAYALCKKMNWTGKLIGGGLKDCMVWVFLPKEEK
jgi:hypothetical protein